MNGQSKAAPGFTRSELIFRLFLRGKEVGSSQVVQEIEFGILTV
jgi:hypothetical protein